MLNFKSVGPTSASNFLVIYETPGCDVPTVACICATMDQADIEADRLNTCQIDSAKAIQRNMQLRGIHGHFPELKVE